MDELYTCITQLIITDSKVFCKHHYSILQNKRRQETSEVYHHDDKNTRRARKEIQVRKKNKSKGQFKNILN